MKRVLGLVVAGALVAGGGIALAGPAVAAVTLVQPASVRPGEILTATGAGCPADATVQVQVSGTARGSRVLAAGTATPAGDYSIPVTLESTGPLPFIGGEQVAVGVHCTGGTPGIDLADAIRWVHLAFAAPPEVDLVLSASQQTYGSPLNLTVNVAPGAPGVLTVTLDGAPLAPDGDGYWLGEAKYTTPADLALGEHELEAVFDPQAEGPDVSAVLTFTVVRRSMTTTTLATSASRWAYGAERATATATVSPALAGTMRFTIGGKSIGDAVTVVAGKASVSLPVRPVGKYIVVATFLPATPSAAPGSQASTSVRVTKATSVAKLKSPKRVKDGKKARLRIVVKVKGVKAPKGKVAIYDGKKKIKTIKLKAKHAGKRTVKIALPKGKHKLSARYLGAKNIKADRSPKIVVRVR